MHENLQHLQSACEKSGGVIFKRWKKKSSEKRKALLLEVDPDMYSHQWSDIRLRADFVPIENQMGIGKAGGLFPDPDLTQGTTRRPFRKICLLPYMNLESLKDDPGRLLNILQNRVKYSPEQWAPYDNSLLDKQWRIGAFGTVYNKKCIIMEGPNYGKFAAWDKRAAHAWHIVGFPREFLSLKLKLDFLPF